MNINDLIAIVKKKLQNQIALESILVEDKSFLHKNCLLYTSPSPRDVEESRMPSSA